MRLLVLLLFSMSLFAANHKHPARNYGSKHSKNAAHAKKYKTKRYSARHAKARHAKA